MALKTGTIGNDILRGTLNNDTMIGQSGGDQLYGAGGDDTVSGGEGADTILGGRGNDVLYGFGADGTSDASGAINATRVGSGLGTTVFAASAPGDPDRLYVVDKYGDIRILNPANGTVSATSFLHIPSDQIESSGEQGLLSVAFSPDYATSGKFYVFVVNAAGDLEVQRYHRSAADPDQADMASKEVIITVPHPVNGNHNGGWLGFGPDGNLYASTGDGGSGGDPPNNAQNKDVLLGKILRLDVSGDDFPGDAGRNYKIPDDNPFAHSAGADEIWAYGLRNPWRPSFDRVTGDLYIADVGQNAVEEVNFQAASSAGGLNYGWKVKEGTTVYDDTITGNPSPDSPSLIDPLIEYHHVAAPRGGNSIIGGYVYRGESAGLQGIYLYADFTSDQIWSFRVVDGKAVDAANRTEQFKTFGGTISSITSFSEDGHGNLYIVTIGGEVFKLDPQIAAGDGADRISGGEGNDRIYGGAGRDVLSGDIGNDSLYGGSEADKLTGGLGKDLLIGGGGADVFDFNSAADSTKGLARDVIRGFTTGEDRLDFSTIDAMAGTTGNNTFTFIGGAAFQHEGEIRATQVGTSTYIWVNTTGKGGAEMQVVLAHVTAADLTSDDFVL